MGSRHKDTTRRYNWAFSRALRDVREAMPEEYAEMRRGVRFGCPYPPGHSERDTYLEVASRRTFREMFKVEIAEAVAIRLAEWDAANPELAAEIAERAAKYDKSPPKDLTVDEIIDLNRSWIAAARLGNLTKSSH